MWDMGRWTYAFLRCFDVSDAFASEVFDAIGDPADGEFDAAGDVSVGLVGAD